MRILIAIVLLLGTAPVTATQVHYKEISLDALLRRSAYVLVVRRLKPASRNESVDITPRGEKPDAAKYPPYVRTIYRFALERVLRAPPREVLPKQLEVLGANDGADLELHRKYYVKKVGESPIYDAYRSATSVKAASAPVVIAFLHRVRVRPSLRFEYVVQGALEPVSELSRVRRALGTISGPRPR